MRILKWIAGVLLALVVLLVVIGWFLPSTFKVVQGYGAMTFTAAERYHWFALAADGMDFAEGLSGLKAAAEKP